MLSVLGLEKTCATWANLYAFADAVTLLVRLARTVMGNFQQAIVQYSDRCPDQRVRIKKSTLAERFERERKPIVVACQSDKAWLMP